MNILPPRPQRPDITNPFALTHLLDFLRRNLVVWLILLLAGIWVWVLRDKLPLQIGRVDNPDLEQIRVEKVKLDDIDLPSLSLLSVWGPFGDEDAVYGIVLVQRGARRWENTYVALWDREKDEMLSLWKFPVSETTHYTHATVTVDSETRRATIGLLYASNFSRSSNIGGPDLFYDLESERFDAYSSQLLEVDLAGATVIREGKLQSTLALQQVSPDGDNLLCLFGSNEFSRVAIYDWDSQDQKQLPLMADSASYLENGDIAFKSHIGCFVYSQQDKQVTRDTTDAVEEPFHYWMNIRNEKHRLERSSSFFSNPTGTGEPLYYHWVHPIGEGNAWYTSSTLPLAFLGNEELIYLEPDGFRIQPVTDLLRPENKRHFDPKTQIQGRF